MAFNRRQYAGAAAKTTLSAGIASTDTTINITSAAGWPDGSVGPFLVVINRGNSTEEKVLITSRSSTALTVNTRGYESTAAAAHNSAETIEHVVGSTDLDEANQAVVNTIGKVTTLGDLLVGSAANALKRLGLGSALQVLRVNSGGTDLEYATPLGLDATAGDITTVTIAASAGAGAVGKAADSGHTHAVGTPAAPVTQAFGDVAAAGTSTTPARADHKHGMPASPSPSLTTAQAQLSGNVSMANANQFYDGPSVSLAAGTWLVSATVSLSNGATSNVLTARLWDGTTTTAEVCASPGDNLLSSLALSAVIVLGGSATVKVSVASNATGSVIRAAASQNSAGNLASTIAAVKVA